MMKWCRWNESEMPSYPSINCWPPQQNTATKSIQNKSTDWLWKGRRQDVKRITVQLQNEPTKDPPQQNTAADPYFHKTHDSTDEELSEKSPPRSPFEEPSKNPPPSPLAVVLLLLFCCCYLLLLFRCCCSATVCTVKRDGDARKYSPHIEVREVPGPPMITPPWKRRWNGVFRKRPLHWRRRCEENTSEWTCCIKSHSTVPKTTQLWRWKAHEGTHLLHHRHYSPLIKLTVNFTPYRW